MATGPRPFIELEAARDIEAVTLVLLSTVLCVPCIESKTGLDLDQVLDALEALEETLRVIRTPWRCPSCARHTVVITLNASF